MDAQPRKRKRSDRPRGKRTEEALEMRRLKRDIFFLALKTKVEIIYDDDAIPGLIVQEGQPPDPACVQLVELIRFDDPMTWDLAWKSGVTPWNKVASHPALCEAVEESGIEFPRGRDKRALVPGCGEGHDVIYIASTLGLNTTGVDISQTAIERAISIASANLDVPHDVVSYKVENFFDLRPQTDADHYDLIYDYTFFVVLHPSQRSEWGRQMAALVKQGGYLITVLFPMEPKRDTGLPWYVRQEDYDGPLANAFEKVLDKVPKKLPPEWLDRRQYLSVWRRM
ncbi:hypothetical protein APHAL10511_004117 [Amanita phalloides]|nr:hypothetical protein APHAL10511_004117 [Amanita phalloides]